MSDVESVTCTGLLSSRLQVFAEVSYLLHIEVLLFLVPPSFDYIQIQFFQRDYLGMAPVLAECKILLAFFQVFLCLHYIDSAYTDCTEGSGSSSIVIFENFLVFCFSFSQAQTIISSFLHLQLVTSIARFLVL